jgi:hypothetical protein
MGGSGLEGAKGPWLIERNRGRPRANREGKDNERACRGKGGWSVDLLCSRNARPQNTNVASRSAWALVSTAKDRSRAPNEDGDERLEGGGHQGESSKDMRAPPASDHDVIPQRRSPLGRRGIVNSV